MDEDYKLEDCLGTTMRDSGEEVHYVQMDVVNHFIRHIAEHAQYYPPRFDNDSQREEIENATKFLVNLFGELLNANPQDENLLLMAGFLNAMGHNMDIQGCAQNAAQCYEALLDQDPESAQANYQYGVFLAGTVSHRDDSIEFLEKALNLGETRALYSLAMVALAKEDVETALGYLKKYIGWHQDDAQATELIEALESGNYQILNEEEEGLHPANDTTPGTVN